jgi:hypothetical protein
MSPTAVPGRSLVTRALVTGLEICATDRPVGGEVVEVPIIATPDL